MRLTARIVRPLNVRSVKLSIFSRQKVSADKLALINRIPIGKELSEFKEFEPVCRRQGKFLYTDPQSVPKSVFLENVSEKSFQTAKTNIQTILSEYPNDVIEDMVTKYGTRVIIYDLTGPDMWQGRYSNGFLKGTTDILLPVSQCMNVGNAKVYFGERFVELVNAHNSGLILHNDKEISNRRIKAVGFLLNPQHRFYMDIEQILAEDCMQHVLKSTLQANINLGVHFIDLYADAGYFVERRKRWRAILGFGNKIGDKLENYGIIKKDNLVTYGNIIKSNPIFHKWMLLLLGGGVSLGGITAMVKKVKRKMAESMNTVRETVVGKKQ